MSSGLHDPANVRSAGILLPLLCREMDLVKKFKLRRSPTRSAVLRKGQRGRRGCGFVGYIFGVIFLKSQEEVQIASTFVE